MSVKMFKYTYWIHYDNGKDIFVVTTADTEAEALSEIEKNFNVEDYFLLEKKVISDYKIH